MTQNSSNKAPLRVANCSGFYGDKLQAALDMVEGGPIDVLTGDYLAELTMAILHHKQHQDPAQGYVRTFLRQVKQVLKACLERNIKIVTNAGGLNPQGMAEAVEAIAAELGVEAKVAYITGDDLLPRLDNLIAADNPLSHLDTGQDFAEADRQAVTANAYLGAWGIKAALDRDADIVICPRVTDAAVVIGPAAWHFGWRRDDYDALAGALVAGHLIECGPSVAGGNYAFFEEVPSFHNMGYPIAEIDANGDFTLTKHPGTGGLISVGTVTAQLLYETNAPAYQNPDVIAHFDTLSLEQQGTDRVRVSGCRGSSPPPTHKVCINTRDTYRNCYELLVTGLDIEAKARVFTEVFFASVGGKAQFDRVEEQLLRTDKANPASNDEAHAILRIILESRNPDTVGRHINQKATELALGSFPGFFGRAPTVPTGPLIKHWPALIDSKHIVEQVHIAGEALDVPPTSQWEAFSNVLFSPNETLVEDYPYNATRTMPFGRLFGARSGDKGGCANLGVWAKTDAAYRFLYHFLTVEQLKSLLPDMAQYRIERYQLPNIRALNFFIHDVLGDGIAATTRTDGQAKSLGEYLRAKLIEAPAGLCER